MRFSDEQVEAIAEAAEPLFAAAVAQGLHAPFALNVESWGRDYAERLAVALYEEDAPK